MAEAEKLKVKHHSIMSNATGLLETIGDGENWVWARSDAVEGSLNRAVVKCLNLDVLWKSIMVRDTKDLKDEMGEKGFLKQLKAPGDLSKNLDAVKKDNAPLENTQRQHEGQGWLI